MEIAVEESNNIITESSFKIRMKDLTIASVKELLQPAVIAAKLESLAPFMWALLHTFASAPNDYRRYHQKKTGQGTEKQTTEDDETDKSDWDDDPNEDSPNPEDIPCKAKGFARNPIFVSSTQGIFQQITYSSTGYYAIAHDVSLHSEPRHECATSHSRPLFQDEWHQFSRHSHAQQRWPERLRYHH